MFRIGLKLIFRAVTRRFGKLSIAFIGVAFAIACLVLLEGIMEGVGDSMIDNSISIHHGNVSARWNGYLPDFDELRRKLPEAESILLRRRFGGTLVAGDKSASLMLFGVDPKHEGRRTVIRSKIVEGDYLKGPGSIVIGKQLAAQLGVKLGDLVDFSRPGNKAEFIVGGIYRTGIELFDARSGFVNLDDAFGDDYEAAFFLPPGSDSRKFAKDLKKISPKAEIASWQDSMPELVQLVDLNHVSMNIVLLLTLLILAFGVSNTVFISVAERTREIGIMKAMGFTPMQIQVLVLMEVILLVSFAAVLGCLVGTAAASFFAQKGIDLTRWTSENPHFIASGIVYPRLTMRSVVLPLLAAFSCGLVAAYLPARRAGKISVNEALRTI